MAHETPFEYKCLMEVVGAMKMSAPPFALVERISYAASDPLFRSAKFHRCLMEYAKYGVRPPRPVFSNVKKELYYIRIRLNKCLNR